VPQRCQSGRQSYAFEEHYEEEESSECSTCKRRLYGAAGEAKLRGQQEVGRGESDGLRLFVEKDVAVRFVVEVVGRAAGALLSDPALHADSMSHNLLRAWKMPVNNATIVLVIRIRGIMGCAGDGNGCTHMLPSQAKNMLRAREGARTESAPLLPTRAAQPPPHPSSVIRYRCSTPATSHQPYCCSSRHRYRLRTSCARSAHRQTYSMHLRTIVAAHPRCNSS
jgi:hypothetical protein